MDTGLLVTFCDEEELFLFEGCMVSNSVVDPAPMDRTEQNVGGSIVFM